MRRPGNCPRYRARSRERKPASQSRTCLAELGFRTTNTPGHRRCTYCPLGVARTAADRDPPAAQNEHFFVSVSSGWRLMRCRSWGRRSVGAAWSGHARIPAAGHYRLAAGRVEDALGAPLRGRAVPGPDPAACPPPGPLTSPVRPWRARLIPGNRIGARTSFEPCHGEAPASWHVVRKPDPARPTVDMRARPPGPLNATTPSSLPSRPGPRRCSKLD